MTTRRLQGVLTLSAFLAISGSVRAWSPSQRGFLLVAVKGDQSLGVVNPLTDQKVAEVPEGGITGHEVTASPDGRKAYVPIYGNSGVGEPGTDGTNMVVIDLASHKVVGNVDFGKGVRPHDPVFGPRNGLLYVTTELNRAVAIIDPTTLKIIGSVPTGQDQSHMLVISRDGKRGYTANVGPGTVSVLDLEARKTITVIPVSKQIQRIALSVDGSKVFTSDQTKPQLAVIDTATNKVVKWVPLPDLGYGTAVTPDGKWLIVANPLIHKVSAVNLNTMKVEHVIDVPVRPQAILVNPNNQVAYASCDKSRKVAVIGLSDWTVKNLIDVGPGADGMAWAKVQ
ncbi:MAG: cytochrome D1 domain-containing protein [Acidobacteriaceae bacterium]